MRLLIDILKSYLTKVVHKKYIKKNGKIFGPYLYQTKRVNGEVITTYIGKGSAEKRDIAKIISLLAVTLLVVLLIFFIKPLKTTGKITEELSPPIETPLLTNVINNNITNSTEISSPELNSQINITTTQYGAVLGKPVKWTKKVELSDRTNVSIDLPSNAQNITMNIVSWSETLNNALNETLNYASNESQYGSNDSSNLTTLEDTNESLSNLENNTIENSISQGNESQTNNVSNETNKIVQQAENQSENSSTNNAPEIPQELANHSSSGTQTSAEANFARIPENNASQPAQDSTQSEPSVTLTGNVVYRTKENSQNSIFSFIRKLLAFTGFSVEGIPNDNKTVEINDSVKEAEIEYYTDAPYPIETEKSNGKEVKIVSPTDVHYENVLSFAELSESLNIKDKNSVRLRWVEQNTELNFTLYDRNNNRIYDYIEWVTPHLSNQTFEIILITKAEHLDSNRTLIGDVYDYVKAKDNNWTTIPEGDYIRVTFEKNLTNKNDITLYARGNNSEIGVYRENDNSEMVRFTNISDENTYKVYLTALNDGENRDTFDLKSIGNVDYDYIVDPNTAPNITYDGAYTVYTFLANGTFSPPAGVTSVSVLIVAGGGGGAAMTGGGGGAGGLIYNSSYAVNGSNISVVVGNGGAGQVGSANPGYGSQGDNSTFGTLVAVGGGYGGTNAAPNGGNGGSGGGCGHVSCTGGVKTSGQGNNGGSQATTAPYYGASGGGGAGTAGIGGTSNVGGGNGGDGLNYSINGSNVYYAGGGGGGSYSNGALGSGGLGGGGAGGAGNAIANTGGGGGGQKNNLANGGNGGSGIVIVRFLTPVLNTRVNSLSPANGYVSSLSTMTFNCSATSSLTTSLTNITLYGNWSGGWLANETKSLTGTLNSTTFTKTVSSTSGNYLWNCLVYDNASNSAWFGSNYTFSIDRDAPQVTINSPAGTIADVTPLINVSSSETGVIWYNIDNGANTTLCTSCNKSQNNFAYVPEGTHTIYIFANDSAGNLNVTSGSFTVNMSKNYYDRFDDNSSLTNLNKVTWNKGNVSLAGNINTGITFLSNSASVQGSWNGTYGKSGVILFSWDSTSGDTTNLSKINSYTLTANGPRYIWDPNSVETRAVVNITGTTRKASCAYDSNIIKITLNTSISDYNLTLYLLDWDTTSRRENITITDNTGTYTVNHFANYDFSGGQHITFSVRGLNQVNITIQLTSGTNAVVSALFVDEIPVVNSGNFTSYPINTTNNITAITNVTWTESNTDANNNITVKLSADNGQNWYSATKGQALGQTFTGANNSLIYRTFFNTNGTKTISLLDMNISWSEQTTTADTSYPQFSNLGFNYSDGSSYVNGITYFANATIKNTNATAGIQFNGMNYSASNTSSLFNSTIGQLAAGAYSYYWWAYGNGTAHNYNVSATYSYTVNKAGSQTNLTFDKSFPQTYGTSITPTCSLITGVGSVSLTNGTSGVAESLGAGTWNINCSYAGNTNYTASSNTTNYVINQANSQVYTYLNNSRANLTINSGTSIWLNGTRIAGERNINLYNNGTLINSGTSIGNLTLFSNVGMYNITTIYPSTQNYSASSEIWWLNVTQSSFTLSISLSPNLSRQASWNVVSLPVSSQPADGNNGGGATNYYINFSVTGGTADLYVKANGNLIDSGNDVLGLGNETYSFNSTDSSVPSSSKFSLTTNYADNKIGSSLGDNSVVYMKIFLSAPVGQSIGTYNNSLLFEAVQSGNSP